MTKSIIRAMSNYYTICTNLRKPKGIMTKTIIMEVVKSFYNMQESTDNLKAE